MNRIHVVYIYTVRGNDMHFPHPALPRPGSPTRLDIALDIMRMKNVFFAPYLALAEWASGLQYFEYVTQNMSSSSKQAVVSKVFHELAGKS